MSDNEGRMGLMSHLEELRKRLIYVFIAIGGGFLVCFNFSEDILAWLMFPLNNTVEILMHYPFLSFTKSVVQYKLAFTELTEPFWMHMKISFIAAIFLTIPYTFGQFWLFISPGLTQKERRYALPFIVSATFMFVFGVMFCQYLILPFAVQFLMTYKTENLMNVVTISKYTDLVSNFLLAFGGIFELPLVIMVLAKFGIVTPGFLSRNRKYAILIAFIVAAVITPTSDIFNMTLMAVPIIVLYEVGIILARFVAKKPEAD